MNRFEITFEIAKILNNVVIDYIVNSNLPIIREIQSEIGYDYNYYYYNPLDINNLTISRLIFSLNIV